MKTLREMIDIVEGTDDQEYVEGLARYFADLYYGDFSSTEKVKLSANICQSIEDGELSVEQLKADIAQIEKDQVSEEATPEAVQKINKLFQDKK